MRLAARRALPLAYALLAVGAVLAVLSFAPRDASAHAILVRSDPPVNAQLQVPPDAVTGYFSESLDQRLSSLEVVDGTGERVDSGELTFGPEAERMSVTITQELGPGFYTVIWETLSSVDGHLLKGSYPFTLLNEDGSQPSGPMFAGPGGYSGSSAKPDNVVVKWTGLLASTALLGSIAFLLFVVRPSLREIPDQWREQTLRQARRRLFAVAAPAVAVLVVVGAGELYLQVNQLGSRDYLDDVLRNTWGERWIQRQLVLGGIAVALLLSLSLWRSGKRELSDGALWLALAAGLAYRLLVAMTSHGNAVPGSFWVIGADFGHLVASAVWIGMLLQLAMLLYWLRRDIPESVKGDIQASHLERFSAFAATSVVVLVATGTVNGLAHIPTLESMVDTAYGRSLTIKLVVIAGLLAIGGVNAFYLRDRVISAPEEGEAAPRLRAWLSTAVRAEILAAVAVIFLSSILVQYPTARQEKAAEENAQQGTQAVVGYEEIQPAGDLSLNLTVSPNAVGNNSFRVFLFPQPGSQLGEVLRVRLRFDPRNEDVGPSEIDMEEAGLNAYRAVGPFLSSDGNWDVHVDVRRRSLDDVSATFPLEVASSAGIGGGKYDYPLVIGGWATVGAVGFLLALLLSAIWFNRLPEPPPQAGRLLRVGSAAATVIGVGAVVITLLPGGGVAAGTNPIKATDESVETGRILYTQNCAQCHGINGDGMGELAETLEVRPADFRTHIPYHSDKFFFGVITNGISVMPPFADQLSEDERWHLLNFLKSEFGIDAAPAN